MCLPALKYNISAGTVPTAALASKSAAEIGRKKRGLFLFYSHQAKAKRSSLPEGQKETLKTLLCFALQGNSTYKVVSVWVLSEDHEICCAFVICKQEETAPELLGAAFGEQPLCRGCFS